MCVGYIRCPVGINIYCCDNQPDCQALQVPTQSECTTAGGTCHLESDKCQTDLGVKGCPQFQRCGKNCSPSTLNPNTFGDLCAHAGTAMEACKSCIVKDPPELWTAIGCVPSTVNGFVQKLLPFAMGLGGGIAFLLMLFGALQIMTSAGNPDKLNAGRELVTSAIVGLMLIIFSIFILRLIGAQILGVPGFG
jgi:hypothetical protein